MGIPLDKASFLALFLETLFYGVFFTLYWLTLFVLFKKTGIQQQLLVPVATLLLCIATAHLMIDFVRALEAFVFKVDTIGANAYYSNLASPLDLASKALYITQTTLADGVVVWRCHVLNHKSRFVAIPGCIVLIVNAATGYYVVWSLSRAYALSNISTATSGCITTFYTLTMFVSVICTVSIAWRIYHTRRSMPGGLANLLPVFIVVIESGALYATSVLALLISFLVGSNGEYIMLGIIPPIVGITFCLIILQVHFHIGGSSSTEQSSDVGGIFTNLFRGRSTRDHHFSMQRVAVHITEEEIVQSDNMSGKNSQPVSGSVFQL
ncbi:uncharacterized protein F5891DRAFT_1143118 [Suillus fuscotomentosus]|uniref:Uncharacterized protein n=1 Tax=Suillus fuscotomentosus TaxID=1912939 RepID=A0AAD4HN00_9AGAM|nr:uncharacterized protein F5891DRAFT_1143118 [Suillus fuscotomentosus]KAG1902638.1 hypothetical protein F5891DRAFT_1143118 [Suillus fuscotomentosus]